MPTKSYTVRFYSGASVTNVPSHNMSQIFAGLHIRQSEGVALPVWAPATVKYQLMAFQQINSGTAFKGVLAVLRDEAPHILETTGTEREIELAENEHLVEKNHFLYFSDRELLVWQVNNAASHISRLEGYLSHCLGQPVLASDIITASALERLNQGVVKRLEFRIAKPRNAVLIPDDAWESNAMKLLNGSGGGTLSVSIATRSNQRGLIPAIKEAAHRLLDMNETRALRVKLGGETEPIDLMAERLKERIDVLMHGVYPDADAIFAELNSAKDRQQPALDAIFGTGDAVLA